MLAKYSPLEEREIFKQCTVCNIEKPLTKYTKYKGRGQVWYRSKCRECRKKECRDAKRRETREEHVVKMEKVRPGYFQEKAARKSYEAANPDLLTMDRDCL